ncbi:hypothetical protein NDU88_002559 [Pleurodeles waltl]|uniref:Uncharacterized protein n=1 Tax=Pleurodeles waltl TaxID=8319 RepID=A0AAV7SAV1_PLEWA|nr:hypothetical protein NDU88_002559 [Pleurodeles waltl]
MTSVEIVRGSQEIVEQLAKHCEDFYSSRLSVTNQDVLEFINDCPMRRLDIQQMRDLEADISVEKVSSAMQRMQSGKALDPNGFPVGLFRKPNKWNAASLTMAFEGGFQSGELPADMHSVTVILFPKSGKPQDRCDFYRLLSLLTADLKILA